MQVNNLPGIVRIEIVRCCNIEPHIMYRSMCGVVIALAIPSENIKFFGTPSLTWSGTKVNGVREERSTLVFATSEEIPEGERFAFIVTVASGRQYIIGAREPRYPIITYTDTTGAPDGEASVRTYKITHIARKSVLPCVL